MSESAERPQVVRFGVFEVDLRTGEVRKHGLQIKIQDQPFQVLAMLLERPGEVVPREELRRRLWSDDTFVDFDHSLNISINKLRDSLGDSSENPRYIETLPRRGYRFIFPLGPSGPNAPGVSSAPGVPSVPSESHRAPAPDSPVPRPAPPAGVPAPAVKSAFSRIRPWLGIGVTCALIFGVIVYLARTRGTDRLTRPTGKMLMAVLPFDNMTGNAEDEYFTEGLTEEMIAQIGRIRPSRLAVVAQTSSLRYRQAQKTVEQIGRELNVDYILVGSVRRAGEQLRIIARLLQVSDQTQLWAETYDRKPADIFAIQTDVAMRVAGALNLVVVPGQASGWTGPSTTNMDAHEAYLLGRYFLSRRTRESFEKACQNFEQALRKDPKYALAYAGLADCYNLLGGYDFLSAGEAFPKAKAAATRALQLDDSLAEAYTSLGFSSVHYDWDWAAGERNFRRAIELNPNYPIAHFWYAEFLHAMGRYEQALAETQRARELDPLSLSLRDIAGWTYLSMRQNESAIEQFQDAHRVDPNWAKAYFSLAFAYARKGDMPRAFSEIEQVRKINVDPETLHAYLGYIQALAGNKEEARRSLAWLEEYSKRNRVSGYSIALIHVGLGEKNQALRSLESALEQRDNWIIWLGVNREWDDLRPDPRFQKILSKIGLSN